MAPQEPGIWLVRLAFPWGDVPPPACHHVGAFGTLDGALRALAANALPRFDWPFVAAPEPAPDAAGPADPATTALAWLRAHTRATIAYRDEPHLAQCVTEDAAGAVVARYLFDRVYLRAHPEALDREHLEILHGVVAAKLLDDDGALVLDRTGIAASLRWVGTATRGVRLSRAGHRTRG